MLLPWLYSRSEVLSRYLGRRIALVKVEEVYDTETRIATRTGTAYRVHARLRRTETEDDDRKIQRQRRLVLIDPVELARWDIDVSTEDRVVLDPVELATLDGKAPEELAQAGLAIDGLDPHVAGDGVTLHRLEVAA